MSTAIDKRFLQPVRGTRDLIGTLKLAFEHIIEISSNAAKASNFKAMETPIFEHTPIFHRLGDSSDVVSKETYTFQDRGGESLTLRPEGTAGVVRALISEGLTQTLPGKYFYAGPMFRYDRPQKGRYRQLYQFGVESFGTASYQADINVLLIAEQILQTLGLRNRITLEINSLGDSQSRAQYLEQLLNYLTPYKNDLSEDSKRRLLENPLRILDSKDPKDTKIAQGAPSYLDALTPDSRDFFDGIQEALHHLDIPFKINPRLVRGLDYYCHTAFEYTTEDLGAQSTVLAGGRYDGLMAAMGGPSVPAVGWALGIDRLALMLEKTFDQTLDLVMIPMGNSSELLCQKFSQSFLKHNLSHEILWQGNVRKRMQKAEKMGTRFTCVIGDDDLEKGTLTLRDLEHNCDLTCPPDALDIQRIIIGS